MGFDILAKQFVNRNEVNGHKNLSVPRILKINSGNLTSER